mmetsp:Transcript_100647/g.290758  ORF Transcript_100647/g.290758 Transcript_100647/m.290758 type:complete len:206 (+) Transcript_100647:448-1065(+)
MHTYICALTVTRIGRVGNMRRNVPANCRGLVLSTDDRNDCAARGAFGLCRRQQHRAHKLRGRNSHRRLNGHLDGLIGSPTVRVHTSHRQRPCRGWQGLPIGRGRPQDGLLHASNGVLQAPGDAAGHSADCQVQCPPRGVLVQNLAAHLVLVLRIVRSLAQGLRPVADGHPRKTAHCADAHERGAACHRRRRESSRSNTSGDGAVQ